MEMVKVQSMGISGDPEVDEIFVDRTSAKNIRMVEHGSNYEVIEEGVISMLGSIRHAIEHQTALHALTSRVVNAERVEEDGERGLRITVDAPFRNCNDVQWESMKQIVTALSRGVRVLLVH
jgi:hypothetical protein